MAANLWMFQRRIAPSSILSPLQPTLPASFESRTQVLTDWKVIGVFDSCPRPLCLAPHPERAAPFSATIREQPLRRRPLEAAIQREKVTEPTYDRIGGQAYLRLRNEMESAQDRYFTGRHAGRGACSPDTKAPPLARIAQLQSEFFACRRRHKPVVEQSRAACVRAYWAANPARGIDDAFFDDTPGNHVAARMSRIAVGWWWREFSPVCKPASPGITRPTTVSLTRYLRCGRTRKRKPSLRSSPNGAPSVATFGEGTVPATTGCSPTAPIRRPVR